MIWRIIATGGALSFLVTGFSVLGNPNCISADLGGGRVVGVTCRQDSYGSFSGSAAGLILCFAGIALLGFIYRQFIGEYFAGTKQPKIEYSLTPTSEKVANDYSAKKKLEEKIVDDLVMAKVCYSCGIPAEELWHLECKACGETTFVHKKIPKSVEAANPEFKTCPMCAEEIKFAAKKCRYCQHMLDN